MPPWTMTRRLIGALVLLIGSLWLVGAIIAAISIRHEINEVFDSALQETAQRLLPLVLDDLGEHEDEERQLSDPFPAAKHKEHLLYQVRDAAGRVILRSHDAPAERFPAPLKRGYFDENGRRYYTETSPDMRVYVQVAELPDERQEALSALWLGLAGPLLGLLPIAALVIYWTVRRTTRPILDIQRQIGMRDGEHLEPIDAYGLPGELTPIIEDMNRLLGRLKAALEAERSFAANSAHELRNPIAAARAQAEIIAAGLRGSPDHVRAAQLIAMLDKLSGRIEKMLQLARAEAGLGLGRHETDLAAVTRLVVEDYARRPQVGARLAFNAGSRQSLPVAIDPDALGIALQNLIDNALSHGPPGATIEIVLGPGAAIHIVNGGPPITQDTLAKLKNRFQRADRKGAPGAGLGLSIVEEIMRQAGGRLELFSPARGRRDGFEAMLVCPDMPATSSKEAAAGKENDEAG
jgi:two-component system, OmpR family, sensor kinase